MGYYKEMIEQARSRGVTSEQVMWGSIEEFDNMLCQIKENDPALYWDFIHKQHKALYKGHYDEEFAKYDLQQVYYINKQGEKTNKPYWTVDQVEEATKGYNFPNGTTKWDKWVAFNSAFADHCKDFDEASILKIGYSFFFADEDWPTDTKIWDYMSCKPTKYKKD
jgi:hypothetical protein